MAGQEKIEEFPRDGGLWFVKWIDEFRLPHGRTRSASVTAVLQKLPFDDLKELSKYRTDDVTAIFGQRKDDPAPRLLDRLPRVMVGTLPKLHIGAVFQDQVHVGELPAAVRNVSLKNGGQEGTETTLGEEQKGPPGWPADARWRLLNRYEFSGVPILMPRSRCLVVTRGDITYVIPRTTIFKAFYGIHTEMAKAFCGGPWVDKLHDVICLNDFESGLKTRVDDSTGQWNIVLQTLVQKEFAPILALLYFDPFARARAESIYAKSLQDRGANSNMPWYASAQIPFRPGDDELRLRFRGFPLRSWYPKAQPEMKKFLVSEITGSAWPNYIPTIGWERFNSGETGAVQIWMAGARPFAGTPQTIAGGPDTTVDGNVDANASSGVVAMPSGEWGWLNTPRTTKLEKRSSRRYEESGPPPPPPDDSVVSTGDDTYADGAGTKGEASQLVREPEKRFDHIIHAFNQLVEAKFLSEYAVIAPHRSGLLMRRGDQVCWSFVDNEARQRGLRPRRGWRLIQYSRENVRDCIYRTALVVGVVFESKLHYWIEIECKASGYRSVLLSGIEGPPHDAIHSALDVIADAKGVKMGDPLREAFGVDGITVETYKHIYRSVPNLHLDLASLKRCFNKVRPL